MPIRTRATTSLVAKAKAQERLKRLTRGADGEVTFPNLAGYETVDQYESNDETQNEYAVDHYRVQSIESEVADVKKQVANMNGKLDMLVNATMANNKPIFHSTPPCSSARQSFPDDDDDQPDIPNPRVLRKVANRDGYVDRMLTRDRFNPPANDGKNHQYSDHNTECIMPKPYMYITRETCQTDKQKLDVRCALGTLEYVNATMALLMDKKAYHPADLHHIMAHLQDVTHDAMERAWPAVRKWSQFIWDAVAKGELRWSDHQLIQNHRVMIAFTGPANRNRTEETGNHTTDQREYMCRDFQSRNGCRHRSSHMDGDVKLLHSCAFCDCIQRQCTHSAFACAKKMHYPPRQYGQIDNQQPFQQQQQQQWRPAYQPTYNFPPMQHPKNGQSAPRQ